MLDYPDFELLISQTVSLVNKRPIAYKDALRKNSNEISPSLITPELLVMGRELVSINIILALAPRPDEDADPTWSVKFDSSDSLVMEFSKLRVVRDKLVEDYNAEFLSTLMHQAIDKVKRYSPVHHNAVEIGDVVLVKGPRLKAVNFRLCYC